MRARTLVIGIGVMFVVAFAISLLLSAASAARKASSARVHLEGAEARAREGRFDEARASLDVASAQATAASAALNGPAPSLVARVPWLGRSVRAAQLLALSATHGARGARHGLDILAGGSPWSAGRLDIERLRAMHRPAELAWRRLDRAVAIAEKSPSSLILPQLANARVKLLDRLRPARDGVRAGEHVLSVLPRVLGETETRRYFLAVQNPAELRATGGFWGNYGIIEAAQGRVRLAKYGRTSDDLGTGIPRAEAPDWYLARYARFGAPTDWRSLNMTPDFPTVAEQAERNLDGASGVGPVDGVIAVDPVGMEVLLRLSGPVSVPGWPEPISADSVVRVTLREAYLRFTDTNQRAAFLGEAAFAVWTRLLTTDIPLRPDLLSGIGRAVRGRRLQFHLRRPAEQNVLRSLRSDGALGRADRTFALVTQNAAGNKMDIWLGRSVRYVVRLREDASANVEIRILLRNGGPAAGEPKTVIGPYDHRFQPGENRQYVSQYVPGRAAILPSIEGGGKDEVDGELGFVVASRFVALQSGEEGEIAYTFEIPQLWEPREGTLRLVLRRQPALAADEVAAEIQPPGGWRLTRAAGMRLDGGRARLNTRLEHDLEIGVTLSRSVWRRAWDIVNPAA